VHQVGYCTCICSWSFPEGVIICRTDISCMLKCNEYLFMLVNYLQKVYRILLKVQDVCFNSTCRLYNVGYSSTCCGALLLEWHVLLQAANRTPPPPLRLCRTPPPMCLGEGIRPRTRSPSIPPSVSWPAVHL
jgi:hypothetical protein